MSAMEVVTATIRQEHHALDSVLAALQRMLHNVDARRGEPDFALFAAALYYIDDFAERCHHPKEDQYLFDVLRRRTARYNAELDELQGEHIRSAQMVGYLHRTLVHYLGGAPDGLKRFREAVDAYAELLRDHMHKEDRLLDAIPADFSEADWAAIAAAFDANDDPMFGRNRREEFDRLYHRIQNLLPRKMKLPAPDNRAG